MNKHINNGFLILGLVLFTTLFVAACSYQTPVTTGGNTNTGNTNTGGTGGNQNSGQTGTENNSGTTTPQTFRIDISGFAFSTTPLNIKKGDTVIWTNKDSAPHTVTSDSGTELDSQRLSQGQTYSHTFDTAGTFTYHCTVHPMMKGTVVVG